MSSHYKYLNNNLILITNVHKFPFLETTPIMSILKRYHLMRCTVTATKSRFSADHEFKQFLLAELAVVNLTGAMAARIGYN